MNIEYDTCSHYFDSKDSSQLQYKVRIALSDRTLLNYMGVVLNATMR